MCSKLAEMLHLGLEPVGIYFSNTEAACDTTAEPGKRNCVVPFILAAARGDCELPFAYDAARAFSVHNSVRADTLLD